MRLSDGQVRLLTDSLGETAIMGWGEKSPMEQEAITQDLMEKLMPILAKLPEGQDSADLSNLKDFFRGEAIELMVRRMRNSMIYRDASDYALLSNLSEPDVQAASLHLLALTVVAIELLPASETLVDLLEHFDDWDVDQELSGLVDDDD